MIEDFEQMKRFHIELILNKCNGNISEAARRLGLHRRTLQRMIRRHEDQDRATIRAGGKIPHSWVKSPLGHGEVMCTFCHGTNREISVIGDVQHCPERARQLMEDR